MDSDQKSGSGKPAWLRRRIQAGPTYLKVQEMLRENRLHTVCEEALCPNQGECFSCGTATFLILGDRCTRNCRFCAVTHGSPAPPDPDEPGKVAETVKKMGLHYVVITSVTRDDLADGGAGHFARTIMEIRRQIPDARVEVLIPDFQGSDGAIKTVLQAGPDVLNHNLETVPGLYPKVRPGADYHRSLHLIKRVHDLEPPIPTKSGLMLGLGETPGEVMKALQDLLEVHCRILTLGQYLRPSMEHLPVERFIAPDEFDRWRQTALHMGFSEVASGPFVRSSYHAHELLGSHLKY
ncbi:MAG: lipoyl synthase [Pseudomonadota bacterium]